MGAEQRADGEARTLTIEFGGTTDPDNLIIVPIPCKAGPVLVVPGFPLRNGLVVKAWADGRTTARSTGTSTG